MLKLIAIWLIKFIGVKIKDVNFFITLVIHQLNSKNSQLVKLRNKNVTFTILVAGLYQTKMIFILNALSQIITLIGIAKILLNFLQVNGTDKILEWGQSVFMPLQCK